MKRIILKLRIIVPVILVILLVGFFLIWITGKDHGLMIPLLVSSYILALYSGFLSRRLLATTIFCALALGLVPLEYMLIGPEHFNANGMLIKGVEIENFFTRLGNFGGGVLAYIPPGFLFIYKFVKWMSRS